MNLQQQLLMRATAARANVLQARSRGMTLVELMVVLAIGMLILLVLFSMLFSTKQAYTAENGVAFLQERQRLAFSVISGVIQTAGYYPTPALQTDLTALPVSSPYATAGQAIYGTAGASASTADTLRVRYQTAAGDQIMTCQGTTNTDTVAHVYDNVFSIAADKSLTCALGVDGGTPGTALTLVRGVSNFKVLYGVDSAASGAPTQYVAAGSVSDWKTVRSVKVSLSFVNPMAGQAGQPDAVSVTQIIQLMGKS